jgi:alpha-glucan phosphorylase-like protein
MKIISPESKTFSVGSSHNTKAHFYSVELGANDDGVRALPQIREFLELAKSNIAWSWKQSLLNILEEREPELWSRSEGSPLQFFEKANSEQLQRLLADSQVIEVLQESTQELRHLEDFKNDHEVAYFCMEFGLTTSLRLYSGGLGVLAGDHLKTASDLSWSLCAVGLAYRGGYFRQRLDAQGQQHADPVDNNFKEMPMQPVCVDGKRLRFAVDFPGRKVWVEAWRVGVGRVPLYLLDTNVDGNSDEDRRITDHLYGGDGCHRLRQEILLGIGGFELLKALGKEPKVYHMNEGHAAFLVWARLRDLIQNKKLSLQQAQFVLTETSVFTTHTPVPAGHDMFGLDQMAPYLEVYSSLIGVPQDVLLKMGQRSSHVVQHNCYSMTDLALSGSRYVNGVSQVHARVSREMFQELYPTLPKDDVPVTGVTNGVHAGTWLAAEWQELFSQTSCGFDLTEEGIAKLAKEIEELPDEDICAVKRALKRRLISQVREHVLAHYPERGESPSTLAKALTHLHEDAFVVGFARRFATYKRATLLFHDIERLEKLIDEGYPIVFLYAGKAHPKDLGGQAFIKQVIEISRRPKMQGRLIFLENYEMDMARLLVQGSDIWLNTPTRPLEASGTSGMKASINGTLNLSVDDGWWSEAYNGQNGWLVSDRKLSEDLDFQLKYDSSQILGLLENEVLPAFFDKDFRRISSEWVSMMRESIISTLWAFSTARMLRDYEASSLKPALHNACKLQDSTFVAEAVQSMDSFKARWSQHNFKTPELQIETSSEGPSQIHLRFEVPALGPDLELVYTLYKREGVGLKRLQDFVVSQNPKSLHQSWTLPAGSQMELCFRVHPRWNKLPAGPRDFLDLSCWV